MRGSPEKAGKVHATGKSAGRSPENYFAKPVDPLMVRAPPIFVTFGRSVGVLFQKGVSNMSRRFWLLAFAAAVIVAAGRNAKALSLTESNIVDLLRESNDIVVGHVESVTDGVTDKGIPYTEVKITISETIRGNLSG